ncbi:MAG TPA: Gldg family protein [Opitutaceae bacterium]|nr:Gldg family protein [Opitutaceae bacterium]
MNLRLRKLLTLVLIAISLVLVNDVASRLPALQADLTHERFFTLSAGSAQMLSRLDRPVEVELYFSASRKGLPIGLKIFAQRVEQLLRQYERRSNGRVNVQVVDPVPGSRAEEEAKRLGLASQPLGPDERLYFGLAVFQGGDRRTIPLIDYRRERLLEYDISRLIYSVQEHRLPKLVVVSSLEVFGKRGMPKRLQKVEDGTAEWQFLKDVRDFYNVQEVVPAAATLPSDTDCLLVINPAGFDPRLLYSIDQYILSGKPAVILLDPYCYEEQVRHENDGPVIGAEYFNSSDLPEFLPRWGVGFTPNQVVGDLDYPTSVPLAKDQPPITFPLWLTITGFDDAQPVTAGFDRLLLAYTGAFVPLPGASTTFTPLVRSSPRSGLVDAGLINNSDPRRFGERIHPNGQPLTLAALVEGRFLTAFPNGKPPPPEGQMPTTDPDAWNLGLKSSKATSRVILIGDSDFLDDSLAYEFVGRTGDTLLTKPRNDNVALLLNSLDYLHGSLGQVPIGAKAQAIRPFTRIHRMQLAAEDSFRQQVESINTRLDQLAQQLDDLNEQAAKGGGSLVSETALTAIRRVQREQNSLIAQRTQVDQQLQASIAALNRRLTFLNLAAVPGLVALGGILFWFYRTRRRVGS